MIWVGKKGAVPICRKRPEGCYAQMGTVPFFPAYLSNTHDPLQPHDPCEWWLLFCSRTHTEGAENAYPPISWS